MVLSKTAILALKGAGKQAREQIGDMLGVHESTVWRWIDQNEPHGDLTKSAVLDKISSITGLDHSGILEKESEVKEPQS